MRPTLVTPPASEAVSLNQAKAHLRVTSSSEDTHIGLLISAACRLVERYVGMSLTTRTLRITLDEFSDAIELPMGPVTAITSITYVDVAGDTQTLDSDVYTLDITSVPQWVVRNSDYSWPTTIDAINAVSVTYTAGYDSVPAHYADLQIAALLLVAHYYLNREAVISGSVDELPLAVAALCEPHRMPVLR